jgi:hypothetical protein
MGGNKKGEGNCVGHEKLSKSGQLRSLSGERLGMVCWRDVTLPGVARRLRRLFGLLMIAAAISVPPGVVTAAPIGQAVGVQPHATGTVDQTTTVLMTGAALSEGETVVTAAGGQVQVLFNDDTRLVIGPRSSLVIERYLMRNEESASRFAIKAISGTFRFISGKSAKDAYSISAPNGTLGVRGTEFDFAIDGGDGQTTTIVYSGAVTLKPTNGAQITITGRCAVGSIIDAEEAISKGKGIAPSDENKVAFPFVVSQLSLKSPFRVRRPEGCFAEAIEETPNSRSDSPSAVPPSSVGGPGLNRPDEPPRVEPPAGGKDNKGLGNGGERPDESDGEGDNPGHGGNLGGGPGNGNAHGRGH